MQEIERREMATDAARKKIDQKTIDRIVEALESISHGSLSIIVQDSKVVQIDKIEKVRFDRQGRNEITGK